MRHPFAADEEEDTHRLSEAYGFVTTAQALGYASDLKLGHYLEIPPESMFWAQLWASLVSQAHVCVPSYLKLTLSYTPSVLVSLGVINWQSMGFPLSRFEI